MSGGPVHVEVFDEETSFPWGLWKILADFASGPAQHGFQDPTVWTDIPGVTGSGLDQATSPGTEGHWLTGRHWRASS